MPIHKRSNPIKAAADWISLGTNWVVGLIVSFFDLFFGALQRWLGIRSMPYIFALPNLLIFGIFILFPMLLNFWYATTRGVGFFPNERVWAGTDNFKQLLTCENFLEPNSCREDLFWRAVQNSIGFVVAQVSLMVLFSLITALVLNRKIRARLFPKRLLLPGTALAYRGRPHLEMDFAREWCAKRDYHRNGG